MSNDSIRPHAPSTQLASSLPRRLAPYAALLVLVGAAACNTHPVIIHYAQRVNSDLYDTNPTGSPHTTTSGGNTVFYITKIENPSDGKTFHFKPSRVYLGNPSNAGWSQSWAFTAVGPWRAQDMTIDPGTSKTNVGCVAVPTGSAAGEFTYFLLYDSSKDNDSVLGDRAGDPNTKTKDVLLSPAELQARCQP
jgi:hypothetical protein